MKKLFGGLNITWTKLIIFSILIGIYVGAIACIPITKDTSFRDISITFEWWVLFGTLIIVNSKTPLESALKCFVFFLISQPIIYLVQVPFNPIGWQIFKYYPGWFVWTLLTIPMGFVGNYLKKDKWWGIFILVPVLAFLGYHYSQFFNATYTYFPQHLLSTIYCAVVLIIFPLYIFKNKIPKYICLTASIIFILGGTYLALSNGKNYYNTSLLVSGGETVGIEYDNTYKVSLEDPSFGNVSIEYVDNIESYLVKAEFKKVGETVVILESRDGTQYKYRINVKTSTYDIERIKE